MSFTFDNVARERKCCSSKHQITARIFWLTLLALTRKPREGFQREFMLAVWTSRSKLRRENKQWACKHTRIILSGTQASHSLTARSHNLFEYHLNIWWIFQQKTIKLPFFLSIFFLCCWCRKHKNSFLGLFVYFWVSPITLCSVKGYLCSGARLGWGYTTWKPPKARKQFSLTKSPNSFPSFARCVSQKKKERKKKRRKEKKQDVPWLFINIKIQYWKIYVHKNLLRLSGVSFHIAWHTQEKNSNEGISWFEV